MLLGHDVTDAGTVSVKMGNAWAAFAADVHPGWPECGPHERLTQLFDTEPTVVPYPAEMSRRIWQDHTFTALPLHPSDRSG